MRVLVTGASGFVGRELVRKLASEHEVVALNPCCAGIEASRIVEGDIADPDVAAAAVGDGCDAVIHLAAVLGGAAEDDPALGWRVNVEGSAILLSALDRIGNRPRFVFASSIAALGASLEQSVEDGAALRPNMLYGAHKAMIETWVATLSRRGAIDGISLRLPGIVARPRESATGLKSAFLSKLFEAAAHHEALTLPVGPEATTWLMSLEQIVRNLEHALDPSLKPVEPYAFTLPAIRVTIGDLVAEVARLTKADLALFNYRPEKEMEEGFGRFPPLDAKAARSLGFSGDPSLEALVTSALQGLKGA